MFPHERVEDPDYFRDVLLSMEWIRHRDERSVRFSTDCITGYPNYQTEYPPGHRLQYFPRCYDGQTHTPRFPIPSESQIEDYLTEPYTWDQILDLLRRALDRKQGKASVEGLPQ